MKLQFRFAGSGGQGIGVMGIIFAEASAIEGKEVAFSQSYGPEARGGESRSDVVVGDTTIYYPRVTNPDYLVILTYPSYDRYVKKNQAKGIILIDSSLGINENDSSNNLISLPMIETTIKLLKKPFFANIFALGSLIAISKVISLKSAEEAIKRRMGEKFLTENLTALKAGYELAINNK